MIESKNDASRNLEKALQALEQAKQRVANEKKKQNEKKHKTLHPEDTDAAEDTLDIVTIGNVLTDNLYNDLGVMVGNNRLLLLLEAQSS